MINIHSSHSKKDLINFILINDLNIINYENKNKRQLSNILEEHDYPSEVDYSTLTEPNQLKSLSVKEKNDLMIKAKQIISYCKNGYNIDRSLYNTFNDLLLDANIIKEYGDIPSCRRAIKLLNQHINIKLNIKLSLEIKEKLEQKKQIKELAIPQLIVKWGKFKIDF